MLLPGQVVENPINLVSHHAILYNQKFLNDQHINICFEIAEKLSYCMSEGDVVCLKELYVDM